MNIFSLIFLAQAIAFPGPGGVSTPSGPTPSLLTGGHGCGGSADSGLTAHTATLNMTGGTIVLACTGNYNATGTAVLTDNCGVASGGACTGASSNSWTALTSWPQGGLNITLWYAANPTVGTGFVLTNTGSGGSTIYPTVCGAGFSGVATVSPFDTQPASSVGGTGTSQTGAMTPGANGELLFSCNLVNSTATATLTVDSGYSTPEQIDGNSGQNFGPLGWSYYVQSIAAAINPTWTVSPSNALIPTQAAFKHQ